MNRNLARAVLILVSILAVACSGNGGGSSGEGGDGGGRGLTLDPESGAPGTQITWTVSGCDETDDKHATMHAGTEDQYMSGGASPVADVPRGRESSGTITVPANAVPGPYIVSVTCSGSTSPTAEGEITISVGEETADFEVTAA
ncbi:MAG: hypothetical protein WD276_06940 [Actinomycetota bacterium]